MMAADAIRLLFFPALMAFAASSDLLTMTISNRLSIALAAGFFLLALVTGMDLYAIGMHLAAAVVVLVFAFVFFSQGWIGGGNGPVVWCRSSARLSAVRLDFWWRAHAGLAAIPQVAITWGAYAPGLDHAAA